MSRASDTDREGQRGGEDRGFCRRWPEVSASERDFWRRAVAEERERLVLAERTAVPGGRPDLN
jgi:hypothetical protein